MALGELVFSVEDVIRIRRGQITATLVMPSLKVRAGKARSLRQEVVVRDDAGDLVRDERTRAVVLRRKPVESVGADGQRTPLVLTVLRVEDRDLAKITLVEARRCGYRTRVELETKWSVEHPHTPRCRLVHFELGDTRDRPRFMGWTGRRGGDYTSDRHRALDEAEALSKEDTEYYARRAYAKADETGRARITEARNGLVRQLYVLRAVSVGHEDIQATVRRLEREIGVLDRKLSG